MGISNCTSPIGDHRKFSETEAILAVSPRLHTLEPRKN